MAIEREATTASLSRLLAEALRAEPAARQLWAVDRPGYTQYWLLTEPISLAAVEAIFGATLPVRDRCPNQLFELHILNPDFFENGDALVGLPQSANEIPLRRRNA